MTPVTAEEAGIPPCPAIAIVLVALALKRAHGDGVQVPIGPSGAPLVSRTRTGVMGVNAEPVPPYQAWMSRTTWVTAVAFSLIRPSVPSLTTTVSPMVWFALNWRFVVVG